MRRDPSGGHSAGKHSAEQPASRKKLNRPARRKRLLYISCTLLAVILLFIVARLAISRIDRQSYTSLYAEAETAFAEQNYDRALTCLRKAEKAEDTAECRLLMAECYLAQENYDKALEMLRTLDTSDPDIAARILQVEALKNGVSDTELVTVNGTEYSVTLAQLNLDGAGIGNDTVAELPQLYSLTSLSLADNSVTDISPLASLGGLTSLDLSGNGITDITPLAGLTALRDLKLDNDPVQDFTPLTGLTGLCTLSLSGTGITEEALSALAVALPSCAIYTDGAAGGEGRNISFMGMTFGETTAELSLTGIGLTDLTPLSGCTGLRALDISGNSVADLTPLMDMPGLTVLNLSNNQVTSLSPLMALTSIRSLNASGNLITSVTALSGLTGLQELDLSNDPISDFSGFTALTGLVTLNLSGTGITDEMLPYLYSLKNLRTLDLSNNSSLTGEAVDTLRQSLPGCTVTAPGLVYHIELGGQTFRDDITELDAGGLGITDISDIAKLQQVTVVDLSSNMIHDTYVFQYLPQITSLDLSNNRIEDITSLASLTSLEYLDLSNNYIGLTGTLINMKSLKELHIGGNLFTESQIEQLRQCLPDCAIYTD